MSVKYICDVCGEELDYSEYYDLELKGSTLEGGYDNIDGIGGHQPCVQNVVDELSRRLDEIKATQAVKA